MSLLATPKLASTDGLDVRKGDVLVGKGRSVREEVNYIATRSHCAQYVGTVSRINVSG